MLTPRLSAVVLLLGFGAIPVTPLDAAEALHYTFRPGETNAYRVQIEMTVEGGVLRYDGALLVAVRQVESESGIAVVGLRGNFPARSDPSNPQMPYRPPLMGPPVNLPPFAQLQVDAAGRVLAEAGDVSLPLQAGRLGAALFVALPTDGTEVNETRAQVAVPDDTPRPGMPWSPPYYDGAMFRRNTAASLQASQTTRVEVVSVTAEQAQLKWTAALQTALKFEGTPRLDAATEGEAVFDRQQGLMREIRFRYRETSASETVTRRSRLTFEARLLEGDERRAALERQAPRTPQTLTAADVRAALADLASRDDQRRTDALTKLQSDSFDSLPPELAEKAEALLDSRDDSVRWVAARIVAEAATAEQVPTLLRLMRPPESPMRANAIQALGRLKDPRAIDPLVEFVARGESERYAAIEALKMFGPEAEEAVLSLFEEKSLETRRAACQILEQVGTAASLDTLREAMLDPDRQLRDQASQAVGAIAARGP